MVSGGHPGRPQVQPPAPRSWLPRTFSSHSLTIVKGFLQLCRPPPSTEPPLLVKARFLLSTQHSSSSGTSPLPHPITSRARLCPPPTSYRIAVGRAAASSSLLLLHSHTPPPLPPPPGEPQTSPLAPVGLPSTKQRGQTLPLTCCAPANAARDPDGS